MGRGRDHRNAVYLPYRGAPLSRQGTVLLDVVVSLFLLETIMEVLQYQVINAGKGDFSNSFCIAAYDESLGGFCRLSKEAYQQFQEACDALSTGTWTLA